MLNKRKHKNRPKVSNRRFWKKHVKNTGIALEKKGYFEDCNYNPCRVSNLEMWTGSQYSVSCCFVDGESLVNNRGTSCSLRHCNPLPLTEKEAFERRDFWKEHGEAAYWYKYVYTDNTLEEVQQMHKEFVENWR